MKSGFTVNAELLEFSYILNLNRGGSMKPSLSQLLGPVSGKEATRKKEGTASKNLFQLRRCVQYECNQP